MDNDTNVCPLLGLVDEQGAYLTYPSYENRCYSSRAPQSIPLNEQTFFCLGGHKERCPRYQSRLALMEAQGLSEEPEAAAADEAFGWESSDDEPGGAATEDVEWGSAPAEDPWSQPDYELDSPPPPPLLPVATAASGRARRPVWPLLLAAGTLLAVLMLCGLAAAGWLGLRALTTQLAAPPVGTLVVEGRGTPTGTSAPGGVVIVVATPTPHPEQVMASVVAAATATAQALDTATPTATPTSVPVVEPPIAVPPTATPTWTPFPVFETPTPRDTPTFFPTNTPPPQATATPTWTPFPLTTATPTSQAFSASFTANPTSIAFGQTSTLSWTVTGVQAMYINGQAISGPSGTMTVQPSVTTTYVLRMIMPDNTVRELSQVVTVSVPSPTATPTASPTPTATPFINIAFAQDLSLTSISGQEATCRTGNGCTLFQVQVRNLGNRPAEYQLTMSPTIPVGWGVFFCWGAECEFGNAPPGRTLAAGARDTVSINFRVPSVLIDGSSAVVPVTGACPSCPIPPFQPYANTFTVLVILPTPTPTWTPVATATPQSGN